MSRHMGMRRGYEALVDALMSLGVDTIFGVLGEGNLDLVAEWTHRRGMRYVAARHEAAAVAMATGYTHVTGKLGVCTVTHGPGLGNTVTALTSAVRARLPVLLIAGDLATDADQYHPQNINQSALVAPTGAAVVNLATPAQAPAAARHALELLMSTTTPVVVNAPTNVQLAHWSNDCLPDGTTRPAARSADDSAVSAAARLLAKADFPVVLAGEGAYRAGADTALVSLAEHLGAPLATSLKAKGMFRDHPLDVGISGGFASPVTRSVLARSDCVLAVGASLNRWTTANGRMFPSATVVHCDIDQRATDSSAAALALHGDARATVERLLDAVAAITPSQDQRRQQRVREISEIRRQYVQEVEGTQLVGQRAMVCLDRLLPQRRTVVVDGGHFMGYPSVELAVDGPRNFLWTSHFGSIGLGLGTAVGAAIGSPDDHLTVLVVGDGGLMMSAGELDTAVRCDRPLVVVVLNDSAYGAEVHFLRHRGLPASTAMFATVRFVDVARALGLRAFRVEDPDADFEALARVDWFERPTLVEVVLSPDEIAPWFRSYLDGAH